MTTDRTDYYQDGIDACADGILQRDCPHPEHSSARVQWMRGWLDFLPIREELEAEAHERARCFP